MISDIIQQKSYKYVLGLGQRWQNNIRSFVSKNERIFEGLHVFLTLFINVALTLIAYRMPPKLDYCFVTSTSLVPVAVSTWTGKRENLATYSILLAQILLPLMLQDEIKISFT